MSEQEERIKNQIIYRAPLTDGEIEGNGFNSPWVSAMCGLFILLLALVMYFGTR